APEQFAPDALQVREQREVVPLAHEFALDRVVVRAQAEEAVAHRPELVEVTLGRCDLRAQRLLAFRERGARQPDEQQDRDGGGAAEQEPLALRQPLEERGHLSSPEATPRPSRKSMRWPSTDVRTSLAWTSWNSGRAARPRLIASTSS